MNHYQEKEIPKWIRIPVGVMLGLITLLCMVGSATLLITPPEKNPLFGFVVGVILVLGCMWVFEKSVRMVFGLPSKGGLMAPRTIRIVAILFLLLPLAGFFTGYYAEKGFIAIARAIGSIGIFFGLNALARSRESRESKH